MDGVLHIDSGGLANAAQRYKNAVEKYDTAMQEIISKLQKVENTWTEAADGEWKNKLDTAKSNLESVKQRLNMNATILERISSEVIARESNMRSGY